MTKPRHPNQPPRMSRAASSRAKLEPLADPDYDPMRTDRETTRMLESRLDFSGENLRIKPKLVP